ncbi:hypothetical protein ABQF35_10410 [Mycobacterium syngnathidarum]
MTEQSPAVILAHPPTVMLRVINPALGFMLRTPFAGPARQQFMVLTVRGRKTGRQYAIPLSAHFIDDTLYALTDAGWKHNFRDGATAEVLHDGKTTTMRGELIEDRATVADLFRRCAESYGVKRAQRMMGLTFRDERIPTLEEFSEAVDREHLVAIKLTPAG